MPWFHHLKIRQKISHHFKSQFHSKFTQKNCPFLLMSLTILPKNNWFKLTASWKRVRISSGWRNLISCLSKRETNQKFLRIFHAAVHHLLCHDAAAAPTLKGHKRILLSSLLHCRFHHRHEKDRNFSYKAVGIYCQIVRNRYKLSQPLNRGRHF